MEYIESIINGTSVGNAMIIMLCAIACDFVSGVIKSLYNNDFKSSELRHGLYKKLEWIVLMLFAYVVYFLTDLQVLPYGIASICVFTEFMSMLENGVQMGLITNSWVAQFLRVTHKEDE